MRGALRLAVVLSRRDGRRTVPRTASSSGERGQPAHRVCVCPGERRPALLTDESGLVQLGPGRSRRSTVDVRRIGFKPFFGKIDLPDTAITIHCGATPLAQQLGSVKVTSRKSASSLELNGFYKRWLDMQKGASNAVFIGPEEIEKRNTSRMSMLLGGVNGMNIATDVERQHRATTGNAPARWRSLIDGRVRSARIGGCLRDGRLDRPDRQKLRAHRPDTRRQLDRGCRGVQARRQHSVGRSTSMRDCGAVALWTGSRKP